MEIKPDQRVKIARSFGTHGAWEKQYIDTIGKVAKRNGEIVYGASGETVQVNMPSGGCLWVEPEALDAA